MSLPPSRQPKLTPRTYIVEGQNTHKFSSHLPMCTWFAGTHTINTCIHTYIYTYIHTKFSPWSGGVGPIVEYLLSKLKTLRSYILHTSVIITKYSWMTDRGKINIATYGR